MKPRKLYKKWIGIYLALSIGILGLGIANAYAEMDYFGINLSDNKEPVELYADSLEIRDKEGIALFNGNVSVVQGKHLLKTSKLVIYYDKGHKVIDKDQINTQLMSFTGFDSMSIKKIEVLGKVYIKIATQIATGDKGVFDKMSDMVVLTGNNVVLTDGDNVVTGCKLTANIKTGKALLEGCETSKKKNRISIVLK
ncbi:LptA/OstA family protein [Bartonella sp. B35(2025)]